MPEPGRKFLLKNPGKPLFNSKQGKSTTGIKFAAVANKWFCGKTSFSYLC